MAEILYFSTMNGIRQRSRLSHFGFVAVLLLSALSLKADPIEPGEGPFEFLTLCPIVIAIFFEAICVWLILWRWRKPRLLILWLMGMHLFTYPLFLGLLWLCYGMHPVVAGALCEGVIVLVEGGLIYLICRFLSSRKSPLPVPSLGKSLFASLIGNICSAATFPLLLALWAVITSVTSENFN
jgi:hypothetical protein